MVHIWFLFMPASFNPHFVDSIGCNFAMSQKMNSLQVHDSIRHFDWLIQHTFLELSFWTLIGENPSTNMWNVLKCVMHSSLSNNDAGRFWIEMTDNKNGVQEQGSG